MDSITNLSNILSNKVYILFFLYITSFDPLCLCVLSIKISVKRHIFLGNASILVKIAHILAYIFFSFSFGYQIKVRKTYATM